MPNAHQRKKQPEQVRRALLDCAARLVAQRGYPQLTVQAVAEAAGVTKGGLFHHFPNRQALVDAVFDEVLLRLDARVHAHLADEPASYGCFTRAYLLAVLEDLEPDASDAWSALCLSMVSEPDGQAKWTAWLSKHLSEHETTDSSAMLEIVRLAADGAWFAVMTQAAGVLNHPIGVLRERLVLMSRQP